MVETYHSDVIGCFDWELQETSLRLIKCHIVDTYHWDVLLTYHWDFVGWFIWDLFQTTWRHTDETLLLRTLETPSCHSNETSWRQITETSCRHCTEMLLGCFPWDVTATSLETLCYMSSSQRLVSRWGSFFVKHNNIV